MRESTSTCQPPGAVPDQSAQWNRSPGAQCGDNAAKSGLVVSAKAMIGENPGA